MPSQNSGTGSRVGTHVRNVGRDVIPDGSIKNSKSRKNSHRLTRAIGFVSRVGTHVRNVGRDVIPDGSIKNSKSRKNSHRLTRAIGFVDASWLPATSRRNL
ncbi:unnamed protein product [Phytophthora fragariaefolia]|uniref:Unnamed protein product n=1 Tax=Phytophthora fragariaefolia TaxID=1490495 RepID=A0A9W6YMA4_9STRA|nr:unnamed protein product [Phytophthora fragariaefolia]